MDHEPDHVKRIAELEATIIQQRAVSEALVDLTRRQAFHTAAETLLRLAQGHRPPGLTDAAEIIRDLWCTGKKAAQSNDYTQKRPGRDVTRLPGRIDVII